MITMIEAGEIGSYIVMRVTQSRSFRKPKEMEYFRLSGDGFSWTDRSSGCIADYPTERVLNFLWSTSEPEVEEPQDE